MHELALCEAIVAQVEELARERGARVRSITLKVGALSGVEANLLERAYPLASAGTRSSAATLHIESLPVRVRCRVCSHESQVSPNRLLCAHCGDWKTDVMSGDELLLASVELVRRSSEAVAGGAVEQPRVVH